MLIISEEQFEKLLRVQNNDVQLYELYAECPSDIGWKDDNKICESKGTCKDCWLSAFRKQEEGK